MKIFDFFALIWNDLPLFLYDFGVFLIDYNFVDFRRRSASVKDYGGQVKANFSTMLECSILHSSIVTKDF